ncbi:MAG: cupin domain-containing protein [Gammaproteobacteria bacterium]
MALPHASSGDIVNVRPLGSAIADTPSSAFLREPHIEVMRLVLPAGKEVPEHDVRGPITLQCLEGRLEVRAHGADRPLAAGELMYLASGVPHALRAIEDTSVLVTIARASSNS